MKVVALLLAAADLAAASKWPLRAPHAASVPASFDCAMRKAAYAFGQKLMPRLGAFEPLFYALDLNDPNCTGKLAQPLVGQKFRGLHPQRHAPLTRPRQPSRAVGKVTAATGDQLPGGEGGDGRAAMLTAVSRTSPMPQNSSPSCRLVNTFSVALEPEWGTVTSTSTYLSLLNQAASAVSAVEPP